MPIERVVLGPRYAVRLEMVQASDVIDATGMLCQKSWRIAPYRLHDRFAAHERMIEIGGRMWCTQCGTGHAMVWHVLRASPPR
jgi:hypothetical protein